MSKSKKVRQVRMPNKVEVGQLFKCHTSFFANAANTQARKTKTEMKEGDILEIRYPSAWHFRIVNVGYFQCSEEDLLINCEFFGIIHSDVRRENGVQLDKILSDRLYTSVNDLFFSAAIAKAKGLS